MKPKTFFKSGKYQMKYQDLEISDYNQPFNDGLFTCPICHAPIRPDQPVDASKKGWKAHKSCMAPIAMYAIKNPKKWKQWVDQLREDSYRVHGFRGHGKAENYIIGDPNERLQLLEP